MSKHEVVEAYLDGQIDRREFVRRLTMAGVSTAAALAYAHALTEGTTAAVRGPQGATRSRQQYLVADADGDGFSDQEETECGSDPDDLDSTCDTETLELQERQRMVVRFMLQAWDWWRGL